MDAHSITLTLTYYDTHARAVQSNTEPSEFVVTPPYVGINVTVNRSMLHSRAVSHELAGAMDVDDLRAFADFLYERGFQRFRVVGGSQHSEDVIRDVAHTWSAKVVEASGHIVDDSLRTLEQARDRQRAYNPQG